MQRLDWNWIRKRAGFWWASFPSLWTPLTNLLVILPFAAGEHLKNNLFFKTFNSPYITNAIVVIIIFVFSCKSYKEKRSKDATMLNQLVAPNEEILCADSGTTSFRSNLDATGAVFSSDFVKSKRSAQIIFLLWILLVASWGILYAYRVTIHSFHAPSFDWVANFLNDAEFLIFIAMYIEITYGRSQNELAKTKFSETQKRYVGVLIGALILVSLCLIEYHKFPGPVSHVSQVSGSCKLSSQHQLKTDRMVRPSKSLYFKGPYDKDGHSISFRINNDNCIVTLPSNSFNPFTIISSVLVATSMALFVGSLQSKALEIPLISKAILYLYSVLQIMYFLNNEAIMSWELFLISLLKLSMYVIMDYIHETDNLALAFFENPTITKNDKRRTVFKELNK